MRKAILAPDLGAPNAILSVWFVDPGDAVYAGDRVVEILLQGATFDVASPVSGRFAEKLALPNDPVAPGQTLGVVDEDL